eukprot:scaffold24806_cov51-Phaeocystis_antarctica.AAC.1
MPRQRQSKLRATSRPGQPRPASVEWRYLVITLRYPHRRRTTHSSSAWLSRRASTSSPRSRCAAARRRQVPTLPLLYPYPYP